VITFIKLIVGNMLYKHVYNPNTLMRSI